MEDRFGSSFAGQFESFLGIESEADFITAIRSCWGALWATRALRYMATHDIDPAGTAMGVLVQPLVSARASGGGLSASGEGNMILSATWGLGSAIAQGEVTPDRYELSRDGALVGITPGRKDHQVGCIHTHAVPVALVAEPCLSERQAIELGGLLRKVEDLMGMPVEIEWAMDDSGFQLLQARPLHTQVAADARCSLAESSAIEWACRGSRLGRRPRVCDSMRMRTFARRAGRYLNYESSRPGVEPYPDSGGGRGRRARRQHVPHGVAGARTRHSDGAGSARCDAAYPGWLHGRRGWRGRRSQVDELMKLVAVTDSVFPNLEPAREVLAKIGAEIRLAKEPKPDAILEVARDADAVLTTYAKVTAEMIPQLKRCRIIGRFGIGVDNVDIPAATQRGHRCHPRPGLLPGRSFRSHHGAAAGAGSQDPVVECAHRKRDVGNARGGSHSSAARNGSWAWWPFGRSRNWWRPRPRLSVSGL